MTRVTILADNVAGAKYLAVHGLSIYIEADINVLFDTGPDNTFIENAKRLNINLNPQYVVLSHGHWDHANGLEYLSEGNLICHPACFIKRYSKVKPIYIGIKFNETDLKQRFTLQTSEKPIKLSQQITWLGQIPRLNNFEAQTTQFVDENGEDDFVPDDSAIAIETSKGLVVISGCAHAGICNTVNYAMQITGNTNVYAVMGGFHLKTIAGATTKTVEYFKNIGVKEVYPSHCTSLPALVQFYNAFKCPQVLTGNWYDF